MIGAKNLNAWTGKTAAAKKRIKAKATDYVRAQAKLVLNEAVKVSPQWSGDYAASWELTTKARGVPMGLQKTRFKATPWQALDRPWSERRPGGSGPASYVAKQNAEVYGEIRWNSVIMLTNNAEPAEKIEAGEVHLRPVNLIPGGAGVMAHLKAKFKFVK